MPRRACPWMGVLTTTPATAPLSPQKSLIPTPLTVPSRPSTLPHAPQGAQGHPHALHRASRPPTHPSKALGSSQSPEELGRGPLGACRPSTHLRVSPVGSTTIIGSVPQPQGRRETRWPLWGRCAGGHQRPPPLRMRHGRKALGGRRNRWRSDGHTNTSSLYGNRMTSGSTQVT